MNVFLFLILLSATVVAAYVRYLRWKTFGRRRAKALRETYDQENLLQTISFDRFCAVMEAVAKSYSVDAEKLRLDDSFKRELGDVDSWMLGSGSERLVKFFTLQYPGISFDGVATIRHMLRSIGEAKGGDR